MENSYSVKPYHGGPLDLDVRLPGSKSLSNRALILSALAEGETRLTNFLVSEDTVYLSRALKDLGINVELNEKKAECRVCGGYLPSGNGTFYVGNAGTAMRFLTSYLCLGRGRFVLDGDERMRKRPIEDLLVALRMLGCDIQSKNENGCPPVNIHANGIHGNNCEISGENSSQYISSILMCAPRSETGIHMKTKGDLASRPYIEMTLGMMEKFGAHIDRIGLEEFSVHKSSYQAISSYGIEPDASSASYFLSACAILGGKVIIRGLGKGSMQGDTVFAKILEKMGCRCEMGEETIILESDGKLKGITVDMNSCPDVVPTLAVTALFADSPTKIENVANLRIKESDRLAVLASEIKKIGASVKETSDGLEIFPESGYNNALIFTYNDHRIAMAFSLAGLKISGIEIENPKCVSKSFPDYFDVFERYFNK